MFVAPGTLASLKKDADYQRAVVGVATKQGENSPWFSGGTVTIDGVVLHEHRLVYTTKGAAPGSKWGAGGNINGTRSLLCGAQALGMADIGTPEWTEKMFQYDSQTGINVDKMFGLVKPKFYSNYDKSSQDFGVIAQDVKRVFPRAVRTRPDGSLAVDYEKLGVLAFPALVETMDRLAVLEAAVAQLIKGNTP